MAAVVEQTAKLPKSNFFTASRLPTFGKPEERDLRLIFSRKGVDSAAGKCASALVGDRPVSIPIPTREPSPSTYGMLNSELASLARDLSNGQLHSERSCHLDPDIDRQALPSRREGWRGSLGQVSASLSHLRNQSVGAGDLFLFWGLYRPVERRSDLWRYCGSRVHAAFGWMSVEEVHEVVADGSELLVRHPWLEDHPHVRPYWTASNAVYVAATSFEIDGRRFPGSGVFRRALRLTAPESRLPSKWSAPPWLDPTQGGVGMTYHSEARWLGSGELQTAARGQEFVADIGDRTDARTWIADLLEDHL